MTSPNHPALEATNLWFAYGAGRSGLHGVSFAAEAGEITMVLGARKRQDDAPQALQGVARAAAR